MKSIKRRNNIIATLIFLIIILFQIFGLVRYLDRMPDDVTGISLYIMTIVGIIIVIIIFLQKNKNVR